MLKEEFMIGILAQAAAGADPMISGAWVVTLVTAVIAALFAGFKGGAAAQRTKIEDPVPEVPTRKVSTPPSWDAHRAVCDRVSRLEESFGEMRREQASQYRDMMQATNGVETRLGEKLDSIARAIHSRIDEAYKPRPPRTRS